MANYKLGSSYVLRVQLKHHKYQGFLPPSFRLKEDVVAVNVGGPEVKRQYELMMRCDYIQHLMLICLGTGEISCYSSIP